MNKEKMTDNRKQYPGLETDRADDEKTTPAEVKQEVRILNNNPRNTDMKMP